MILADALNISSRTGSARRRRDHVEAGGEPDPDVPAATRKAALITGFALVIVFYAVFYVFLHGKTGLL